MPRYQSFKADCGPSALGNALDALGHLRSHDELISLCGTTADGTSPRQLWKAISALRESCSLVGPGELKDAYPDVALLRLGAVVADGRPAALLVDDWEHWVAVCGRLGHTFIVADSAHLRQTLFLSPSQLAERWGHSGATRARFYGIAL